MDQSLNGLIVNFWVVQCLTYPEVPLCLLHRPSHTGKSWQIRLYIIIRPLLSQNFHENLHVTVSSNSADQYKPTNKQTAAATQPPEWRCDHWSVNENN